MALTSPSRRGRPYCQAIGRAHYGATLSRGSSLAKHSRSERERRKQENEAVERIQAAWLASVPADRKREMDQAVAAARARGPQPRQPDMEPGTKPNPPRPGREPKPKSEPNTRSRR
jgi:hypothetical protein